ncbi:hypothetical protein K4A83_03355 [Spirulina subsalsa FACHB-351]|uniref:Uncharacterized protein n=1 Tax=Spirulina subsalsa FACHB-351 TaxID=234711 RepID=A0ABT3L1I7_9CYAN|nr:hypothetical protein [Spirulina subsalsa]MCW6035312.1 hypothetical protein [Spirulina subsalsa FACHB-351]
MRPELQRIESTLEQLEQLAHQQKYGVAVKERKPAPAPAYPVAAPAPQRPAAALQVPPPPPPRAVSLPQKVRPQQVRTVAPAPSAVPTLPELKSLQLSNHRHSVNPALATNLLKEIEEIVVGWQRELKQILVQIQDLYLEGPIVDGWLESHQGQDSLSSPAPDLGSRPGYRLCGLDEKGRLWTKPCPADQVASVSMAIARYQKLRQLLKKKQSLENRLSSLAETLVIVHSSLKDH